MRQIFTRKSLPTLTSLKGSYRVCRPDAIRWSESYDMLPKGLHPRGAAAL